MKTLRRLLRQPLLALGAVLILLLAAGSLFAPWIALQDPLELAPLQRLRPPGEAHWLGTDMLGRDLFARVLHGGRISITVGVAAAALASLCGLAVGLLSGFLPPVDAVLMRVMDGMMAIPGILLAIAITTIVGGGLVTVIAAIAVTETPVVARLVRGVVLTLRQQLFVEAARAVGTRTRHILLWHILPNTIGPLLVQATYICGVSILIEAYLSFLGAGIPPETPSWGNIMAEGRNYVQIALWILGFPGLLVALMVLSLNLLGDGLRDWLDPRTAKHL